MKKLVLLTILATNLLMSQEVKQIPQINVSGEGKIKVIPDEAIITASVETNNKLAKEAKSQNDEIVDKVIKLIKKHGIALTDFQTTRVNLYNNYDYNTKKSSFVANQTITIHLKDLNKYNDLMTEIVNTGINGIQGVEFKSSKIKELEREARKKAILDAKQKAEDYVSVLQGQKVGKALTISDNSNTYYPQPMYAKAMSMNEMSADTPKETLAIGEIEITSNVVVSFMLD